MGVAPPGDALRVSVTSDHSLYDVPLTGHARTVRDRAVLEHGGFGVAKHAFAVYVLSLNERGRPSDRISLRNVRDQDFLHLLHGLLKDVEDQHVRAEKSQHILTVEDVVPAGRAVKFKTQYGRFGLHGRIVNVETARVTHEYDDTESPVSPTRNMFVIPEHGEFGLLLAERYGGSGAATMIKSTLNWALRAKFSDEYTLHFEAMHDTQAWQAYVQRAEMLELSINRYRMSSDRADRTLVDVVGKEARVFKPRRGVRFPASAKNGLLNRTVRAHDLVGIEFSDEDEVMVSLDDGNQKKQVSIQQAEPPSLVYEVADDTADRPTDTEFYAEMVRKAPELASEAHFSLPTGWISGEWTEDAKKVTMRAHRD